MEYSNSLVVNTLSRVTAIKIRSSQGDLNRSHSLVGHFVGQTLFSLSVVFGPSIVKKIYALKAYESGSYISKWKDPAGEQDDRLPTASWNKPKGELLQRHPEAPSRRSMCYDWTCGAVDRGEVLDGTGAEKSCATA